MEELNEILGMSVYRYIFRICLCVFFYRRVIVCLISVQGWLRSVHQTLF